MSAATVSHEQVIRDFKRAYKRMYEHEPKIYYVGNMWYQVNGEAVHHSIMMQELERLYAMLEMQQAPSPKRNAVQRLINKLRFM